MQKRKNRNSEFNTLEMVKLLLSFTTFTLSCFFMIMYGVTGKLI
ncbi:MULTISPECIES: hypothetical protein [unclassified Parvimonas]|nr:MULTISPECIES: hypothetical protein [unclassified Parvimonas]MEB3024633.1 hypothetical protein [Parvimonas sp. M13]MEB3072179.1 hypothetical protein [Parvimonas sp. C2]MEB3088778.1 hypothetical protein [Parvimonas sp. M20]